MRSIKCVVIGDGAVGKTSLLISYTTNTFPQDYVPTVFDNYTTTISLKDPNITENSSTTIASNTIETHSGPTSTHSNENLRVFKLNLWDTAGQEEYDRLRPLSYPQTDIFLICFAITEKNSFRNVCDKWLPELKLNSNIENNSLFTNYNKLPILLVGTKADLDGTIPETDSNYISKEEIEKCVNDNGFMGYIECSAMTQVGVREVFEKAIESVVFEPERLALKQKKITPLNNAFSTTTITDSNTTNTNDNHNDKFKLLDHHHHHNHSHNNNNNNKNNNASNSSSPANNVITNSSNNNSNSSTNKQKQSNNNSQRHSNSHQNDKQTTTKTKTTNGNNTSSSSKKNKKKKDKCIIM